MCTKIKVCLMTAILCIVLILTVTSCGNKTENLTNEPDITVEYLNEDYSQQLLKDGGHNFIGSIEMEKAGDGNVYLVHFSEREVVANTSYENGYYIADTNMTLESTLGSEGRIVCFDENEAKITSADEFIKVQNKVSEEKADEKLYSVYFMGTSAELIIEIDPASAIAQ